TENQVQQHAHSLVKSGCVSGDHNRDGNLQGQQAAGVVDQALAFNDVGDARGQPKAAGDGGGGDCVGGANHGAKNQTEAPAELRQDPMRGEGHAVNGEADETQSQQRDARDVVTEIAPRSLKGRGEKQRRQEKQKYDVGIQLDMRYAGNQADEEACNHQDYGIRRLETLGESRQQDNTKQ